MNKHTKSLVAEAYIRLLPVQILGIVVNAMNGFIDSLITGKFLGTEAIAAIGYFGPVATIIGVLGVITSGLQIMCSNAIGSGDKNRVVSLYSTGILFLSIVSVIVTAVCMAFHTKLSFALGGRGVTAEMLSGYIIGYAPGIIGQVLSAMLIVFLPFNNDTKRSYAGIATMIVTNVGMDILNALVLHWGCFGMGLATTISFILSSLVMLTGFIGKERTIHLRIHGLSFSALLKAAYLGLPILMFSLGCSVKAYIINIALMKNVGDAAVAVMNVQNNIIAILGAIPLGCSFALLTLASLYYGDEDRKSFIEVTSLALRIGILLSVAVTAILMAGSGIIPSLFFKQGEEAFAIARRMLLIFPNWLIFNLIFNVFMKVYQSQEKMLLVNIFSFVENIGIALIAAGLTYFIGSDGVWISFTLCEVIFLIIVMISVFINAHRITFSLEDWMKLSDNFGAKENECLEFSIKSMDDVINISERVVNFCKEKGLNNKSCMIAGLTVEEMAGNVVTHGFNDGKTHSVDVRIVIRDFLIIRIRDDCREFNPQKYLEQFEPEDPAKNIGIRMISGMAKEMTYQNNAGINTLLVKI